MSDYIPPEQEEEYAGEQDEYYENEEEEEQEDELAFLPADHPRLQRLQAALTKQLSRERERLVLQMREKEEVFRTTKKKHEMVGVELYGFQQQLAKTQMALEKAHDNFNVLQRYRVESDDNLQRLTSAYDKKKKDVEDVLKKVAKAQDELNQLNKTLRQVEEYNTEMKSEIAVTRRATYRAEEAISNLEKEKKVQDFLIDSMNEEVKKLQQSKALYEAQLVSQKQETDAAVATLQEAAREMENIMQEKKALLQRWQSSLVGMQRRDEALQATHDALRDQREQEQAMEAEVRGYKQSIRQEQERNERLVGLLNKSQNEGQFLTSQMESLRLQKERLTEQYTILKKALDQTLSETSKVENERQSVDDQLALVDKNIAKVSRESQALLDDIMVNLSSQTTIQKGTANVHKQARKLHEEAGEKNSELQQLENEMERIRVDALNTAAKNQLLSQKLSDSTRELKDRETLIDKYELEIRQRNDQIEKKQHLVDRLNRKYDELTHNMVDENTGPLEATIKNLGKSITDKDSECAAMQRDWIKQQTALVNLQNESQRQEDAVHHLKAKKTILNQKRVRLNNTFASHEGEVKALKAGLRQLRVDMTKLNELIARHTALQQSLVNDNFNMETEFVERLKEMEEGSQEVQDKIETIKAEKNQILDDIVECERQMMQWERKIELEKEMQATIDPEIGQAEVQAMKKEIHRMELRYEQLKRRQEQMIQEMERAVFKRENIALKYASPSSSASSSGGSSPASTLLKSKTASASAKPTHQQMQRQLTALKSTLKNTTTTAQQMDQALRERLDEVAQIGQEMEETALRSAQLDEETGRLRSAVAAAKLQKQKNMAGILRLQKLSKKYEEVAEGKYKPLVREELLSSAMQQQQDQLLKLTEALQFMRSRVPHLSEVLDLANGWAASALNSVSST